MLVACALKWVVFDSLWMTLDDTARTARTALAAWPVVNLQLLVGGVVIAALLLLGRVSGLSAVAAGTPAGARTWAERLVVWLPFAAGVMLLWGLTFEVERAIGRWEQGQAGDGDGWSRLQVRMLWWTLLWSVGGAAQIGYGKLRSQAGLLHGGWAVLLGAGGVWLLGDTLADRVASGVTLVSPVLNLQFLVGAALIGLLAVALRVTRREHPVVEQAGRLSRFSAVGWGQVALIGLWLGSFELDRWFSPEAGRFQNAAMARHTAFSIYWGLYAIGLVAVGFVWRSAWCRYGGLALLAVTLGKVLLIDLAEVAYVYRVLSLLGVGLLLVGTSVAYGKLAPRLLGQSDAEVEEGRASGEHAS